MLERARPGRSPRIDEVRSNTKRRSLREQTYLA
jgi:hypothetical protein